MPPSFKRRSKTRHPADEELWTTWLAPVVAVLLYLPACSYPFLDEDQYAAVMNPDADSSQPLVLADLFSHDTNGIYLWSTWSGLVFRPLTVLSFRLNHYMSGGVAASWVFHATNVFLYGLAVLLFQAVLNRVVKLPPSVSSLAALLFATHPTHPASVTAICGRAELLCSVFQFVSLLIWGLAADLNRRIPPGGTMHPGQAILLVAFLVLVAVGCLAHPFAALSIPLALAAEMLGSSRSEAADAGDENEEPAGKPHNRKAARQSHKDRMAAANNRAWLWHSLAFLCLAIGVGIWVRYLPKSDIHNRYQYSYVEVPTLYAKGAARILAAGHAMIMRLAILLTPFGPAVDYSFNSCNYMENLADLADWRAVIGTMLYALVGILLWRSANSLDKQAAFALLWLLIQLAPLADPILSHGYGTLDVRSLFLPSAPICMLTILVLNSLDHQGLRYVAIVMALVLGGATFCLNPAWDSQLNFWETALAQRPLNAKANFKVASLLAAQGALGENPIRLNYVMDLFIRALSIYPRYDSVYVERAKIHLLLKDDPSAEDDFLMAADSGNPEAHFQLGLLYMTKLGKEGCDDAEWHFQQAITKDPDDHRSYTNMGICRYWRSDITRSVGWLDQALKITPKCDMSVPADAMASIYRIQKNYTKALELHKIAVDLSPDSLAFRANLAYSLYEVGNYLEAAAEYDEVAAKHPEHAETYKANADLSRQMLMNTINVGKIVTPDDTVLRPYQPTP